MLVLPACCCCFARSMWLREKPDAPDAPAEAFGPEPAYLSINLAPSSHEMVVGVGLEGASDVGVVLCACT
jgi:hypothetical protein